MSELRQVLDELNRLRARVAHLEASQEHPGFAASDVARLSTANTYAGIQTIPNTGLHLLDTNATHDLIVVPGSDLTADRTLTLTTGDANRVVTLSGDLTVPASGTVALLGTANAFTKGQTITPDTAGGNGLKLDTAASPTGYWLAFYRNGTNKISVRCNDDNYVEERRNFVALANDGVIDLPYAIYMLEIIDASGGNYAEYFCRGGADATVEILDTGTVFTTVKDTASSFNIYYESSAYHLQNKRGVSRNVALRLIRGTSSV